MSGFYMSVGFLCKWGTGYNFSFHLGQQGLENDIGMESRIYVLILGLLLGKS